MCSANLYLHCTLQAANSTLSNHILSLPAPFLLPTLSSRIFSNLLSPPIKNVRSKSRQPVYTSERCSSGNVHLSKAINMLQCTQQSPSFASKCQQLTIITPNTHTSKDLGDMPTYCLPHIKNVRSKSRQPVYTSERCSFGNVHISKTINVLVLQANASSSP